MAVELFLEPNIRVCRESCAEDHVPSGHYARKSSQKNSEVTHKREVEDQRAPLLHNIIRFASSFR